MDRILRLGAPALLMALVIGCGAQEATPPASETEAPGAAPAPAPAKEEAPAPAPTAPATEAAPGLEGPKTSAVSLEPDEIANIKKLPAAEVDAALKQAVCPVSDEHLGAMDVPVKVTAEGRTIYLCCDHCKEAVTKDPKKYMAILDKK